MALMALLADNTDRATTFKVSALRLVILWACACFQIACGGGLEGEYSLNLPSKTQPEVLLTRVNVLKDKTIIGLRMDWPSTRAAVNSIGVFPPGHQMAFFIMSTDRSRRFNLLDVEGVAIRPTFTSVRPGENVEFTLTFERIDDDMSRFHLIEGDLELESGTPWHFLNVTLLKG